MEKIEVTAENYAELRKSIAEKNGNLSGVVMREKEQKVNNFLERLKDEYRKSCDGKVPYNMPVLTNETIKSSRLYDFFRMLPKGADLHVHDMTELPVRELIKVILSFGNFYINGDYALVYSKDGAPEGYTDFAAALESGEITEHELLENWTVLGAAKSGTDIWEWFENLFDRHAALSDNPEFAAAFYEKAFRYYCENKILHVEIHLMLTGEIDEAVGYVTVLRDAYKRVKKEYPYFTVRIIGAGVKADNEKKELTKKCFLNTVCCRDSVKDDTGENPVDFVIGFDLVNEEDGSLPLSEFAPMLLKVKKQYPGLNFYIHGGESLSAGNDNLIDAYLLGASRVGHGLNLYRYPDLLSRYVKSEICLEVCPISNQTLGYASDIRNHPATEYLKSGVAMALCSDDPVYQENETLTDDYFAATVGWDINLADIKQLGINSIIYSGLGNREKYAALRVYAAQWNTFIDEIIAEEKL